MARQLKENHKAPCMEYEKKVSFDGAFEQVIAIPVRMQKRK